MDLCLFLKLCGRFSIMRLCVFICFCISASLLAQFEWGGHASVIGWPCGGYTKLLAMAWWKKALDFFPPLNLLASSVERFPAKAAATYYLWWGSFLVDPSLYKLSFDFTEEDLPIMCLFFDNCLSWLPFLLTANFLFEWKGFACNVVNYICLCITWCIAVALINRVYWKSQGRVLDCIFCWEKRSHLGFSLVAVLGGDISA